VCLRHWINEAYDEFPEMLSASLDAMLAKRMAADSY
jgi:hypothetical protein